MYYNIGNHTSPLIAADSISNSYLNLIKVMNEFIFVFNFQRGMLSRFVFAVPTEFKVPSCNRVRTIINLLSLLQFFFVAKFRCWYWRMIWLQQSKRTVV